MLSSSSVYVQPLWFYVVVYWCVVDNFYLWYCVEVVIGCHEVNNALDDVTDLDDDIPQEGAACPLSHDHDCFWVQFVHIELHGRP